MIRKDSRAGVSNISGTGVQHGQRQRVVFEEDAKVFFVENHRTVRPASVIRRMGDFYTIGIGTGGIKLRGSRLFATEEEAKTTIETMHTGSNDIGMRGYPSVYSYANSRSPLWNMRRAVEEMNREIKEQEDSITVHCNCGYRLFDMERDSTASVSIKCQKCRAVMVVTMKNQKYKCMDKRIMAYAGSIAGYAAR